MLRKLTCRCFWRRIYCQLFGFLFLRHGGIRGRIVLTDRVVATLRDGDGRVVRRITREGRNKWGEGKNSIAYALENGCGAAPGLKAEYMKLGSQCSDTNFTLIAGTEVGTTNSHPGDYQVKFASSWPTAGAVNNICQVCLRIRSYTGIGNVDVALYNFGSSFNKADGQSLQIEWTTTITS